MPTPFLSHMQKAWLDTVKPLRNQTTEDNRSFANYFLAWPEGKGTTMEKLLVYLFTLRFTVALLNMARRPLELGLNAIAEVFSWANESLRESDNILFQGLSWLAFGFECLFNAAKNLVVAATSPMTHVLNAQAERKSNSVNAVAKSWWSLWAFAPVMIFIASLAFPPLTIALAASWVIDVLDYSTVNYLRNRADEHFIHSAQSWSAENPSPTAGVDHVIRPANEDKHSYDFLQSPKESDEDTPHMARDLSWSL